MPVRKFERILDIFFSFFIITVRELYRSMKRGAGVLSRRLWYAAAAAEGGSYEVSVLWKRKYEGH